MELEKLAKETAKKIKRDICGRSGGDHWFDQIDSEVQDEIIEKWTTIIEHALEKAVSS